MDVQGQILAVLDEILSLNGRAFKFDRATHLLGAIPELDSMAVVSLIAGLEDRFGMVVEDDDIDGEVFASVGSLVDFVSGRIAV